jgi:hypothetical protein
MNVAPDPLVAPDVERILNPLLKISGEPADVNSAPLVFGSNQLLTTLYGLRTESNSTQSSVALVFLTNTHLG